MMDETLQDSVQNVLQDELLTDEQYKKIKSIIRTATLDDDVESVIFALRDYKGFRHWHDDVDQDEVKQHIIDSLRGNDDNNS